MTQAYNKGIKTSSPDKQGTQAQPSITGAPFFVPEGDSPTGGLFNTQVTEEIDTQKNFNDYLHRCFAEWEQWLADHELRRSKKKLERIAFYLAEKKPQHD